MTKKTESKYATREEWLAASVRLMEKSFTTCGYEVPAVRVACGWPSSRGLSAKKRVLGEAWCKTASADGVAQIFISPFLDKPCEPFGVLPTLLHEVVHAVVGNKEKHNKVFGKCARSMGLEGKLTATFAGTELLERCAGWEKELGEYPHAKLDSLKRPVKKQTTRMVKMECKDCGYVARASRKHLEETGACICQCNKQVMHFEIPDEIKDDEDDDGGNNE